MEEFGVWFRDLREKTGISVRQLAKVLGVTPSYLSQVERGLYTPLSVDKLAVASVALNTSMSLMLTMANRCEHCGAFKKRDVNIETSK